MTHYLLALIISMLGLVAGRGPGMPIVEIAYERCLLTPPVDKEYCELRAINEKEENGEEVGYFATAD